MRNLDLPRPAAIVAFVVVAAMAAAAFPLLVYSTTLAAFGLAHVASELWYVDHRFGRRVRMELVVGAAVLLAAVVVVRLLTMTRVVAPADALVIELALVCALGALALPTLFRKGAAAAAVGIAVVGALAFGTMLVPAMTLSLLAIVHNATPVGFLVERAEPGAARVRMAAWCAIAFVAVPLLVASGAIGDVLAMIGIGSHNASVLPTGPLRDHLYVYLPRSLHALEGAPDWFAAVVCAQVLHYGAVIGVLPRLVSAGEVPRAPWPAVKWVVVGIVALGVGLFVHFAIAFAEARSIYGLAAGVHAWIEVPVLLLAVAGFARSDQPERNNA